MAKTKTPKTENTKKIASKKKRSFGSGLLILLVVLISAVLVSSGLVMVFNYSDQIDQEAGIVGMRYS